MLVVCACCRFKPEAVKLVAFVLPLLLMFNLFRLMNVTALRVALVLLGLLVSISLLGGSAIWSMLDLANEKCSMDMDHVENTLSPSALQTRL